MGKITNGLKSFTESLAFNLTVRGKSRGRTRDKKRKKKKPHDERKEIYEKNKGPRPLAKITRWGSKRDALKSGRYADSQGFQKRNSSRC